MRMRDSAWAVCVGMAQLTLVYACINIIRNLLASLARTPMTHYPCSFLLLIMKYMQFLSLRRSYLRDLETETREKIGQLYELHFMHTLSACSCKLCVESFVDDKSWFVVYKEREVREEGKSGCSRLKCSSRLHACNSKLQQATLRYKNNSNQH